MVNNDDKTQSLRDSHVQPTSEVIAKELESANSAYSEFIDKLKKHDITVEWRYYTDGNAWLGKGLHRWTGARGGQKEMTSLWISIWKGFFKVTIYIPERARTIALDLPLTQEIQHMIASSEHTGKLTFFPMIFDLSSSELFHDSFTLLLRLFPITRFLSEVQR